MNTPEEAEVDMEPITAQGTSDAIERERKPLVRVPASEAPCITWMWYIAYPDVLNG